jgi:formiminotetrahydrofolate cyclodeaminase
MLAWIHAKLSASRRSPPRAGQDPLSALAGAPGAALWRRERDEDLNRDIVTVAGPADGVRQALWRCVQAIDETQDGFRLDWILFAPLVPDGLDACRQALESLARQLRARGSRAPRVLSAADEDRGAAQASDDDPRLLPLALLPEGASLHVLLDGDRDRVRAWSAAAATALRLPVWDLRLRFQDRSEAILGVPLRVEPAALPLLPARVAELARDHGLTVRSASAPGLLPRALVERAAAWASQRPEFAWLGGPEGRVLEDALEEAGVLDFNARLASAFPVPGGGAAAARAGQLGASLLLKVIVIALRRSKGEDQRLMRLESQGRDVLRRFQELERRDQEAFLSLLDAHRGARSTPEETERRDRSIRVAARAAIEAPISTLETALALAEAVCPLADEAAAGELAAESDLGVAIEMARAAFDGSIWNVDVNLPLLKSDPSAAGYRSQVGALSTAFQSRYSQVHAALAATPAKPC